MLINRIYYALKPFIPRRGQVAIRRFVAGEKRRRCRDVWPILPSAATRPENWPGWPDKKAFALVLTHDVDTQRGHERCRQLAHLERSLGFISSFNFVAERYAVCRELQGELAGLGFEIGVHGIHHDGKKFQSYEIFRERAAAINRYLALWGSVGFRSPAMHSNLDWILDLDILYDASTFDTDPFEPQPTGVGTIFPFYYGDPDRRRGYVEMPYTLAQDFTVFILLKERDIGVWREKLDWIAAHGGMALLNTHPDYMHFGAGEGSFEEYSADRYREFLEYVDRRYRGEFWHALPREVAAYVKGLEVAGG